MKLKAQTPQKGKKVAPVNGNAAKVQKSATPLKNPTVLKANKKQAPIKKNLQPKKKMVEIHEDEDESDEEEEVSQMDAKESDSEDEQVSGNGAEAEASDGEDDDDDEEEDDEDEENDDEEDEEVETGKDLIDNEAEEAEDDNDDDDDDEDDDGEDDDDEQEEVDDEEKIPKDIKKVAAKKSAKATEPEGDDSDDEAPEEAPATKKSKEEETPESVPIINFKTIPKGTPDDQIIHLKNLPALSGYDHGDIANIFSKYGKMIAIIRFPGPKVTTAFVAFTSAEAAAAALEAHRKVTLKGQLIDVCLKRPKNPYCQKNLTAYVGNLTSDILDGDLREHFAQAGVIKKVSFLGTNKKRFAFIEFADEETLKKALTLNFSKIKDVTLEVKSTNRDDLDRDEEHTIVIANTQNFKEYDEEKLKKIFNKCGAIRNVDLLCKAHILAFISFEDPKDAEKALSLNGKTEDGLELNITKYTFEKTRNYIIFIKNVFDTTEEYLRKLFSRCGEVGIIKINKNASSATIQFNDKEAYCKSFLLNEHYINNVPIFIQPFSLKRKLSRKGPNMKHLNNKGFKKPGEFRFNKKPHSWGPHKGGDHFTAPFYRKGGPGAGGKFGNKGPGFKKFPAKKQFTNESVAPPKDFQEKKSQVAETPMKMVPKAKKQIQNIESTGPKSAAKRPKTQKNTDEGAKNPKKVKKFAAE